MIFHQQNITSAGAQDLEEEILGDVEPVTEDKDQDKVEDQDITDKVRLVPRATACPLTNIYRNSNCRKRTHTKSEYQS